VCVADDAHTTSSSLDIWVVVGEFHGHYSALVGLVKELHSRGHEITLVAGEHVRMWAREDHLISPITTPDPAGSVDNNNNDDTHTSIHTTHTAHSYSESDTSRYVNFFHVYGLNRHDAGDIKPYKLQRLGPLQQLQVIMSNMAMDQNLVDGALFDVFEARKMQNLPLPDLFIADILAYGAYDIAELFDIPLITVSAIAYVQDYDANLCWFPIFGSGFSLSNTHTHQSFQQRITNLVKYIFYHFWVQPHINEKVNAVRKLWNLPPYTTYITDNNWLHPTIIGVPWGIQYAHASPPSSFWVGSMSDWKDYAELSPQLQQWIESDASLPILYVSFGTFSAVDEKLLLAYAEGIISLQNEWRVLWSLKQSLQKQLSSSSFSMPTSETMMRMEPYVPQKAVLAHPNVRMFYTHGGINSLIEAVHFGVPVLCTGFHTDQYDNWYSTHASYILLRNHNFLFNNSSNDTLHTYMQIVFLYFDVFQTDHMFTFCCILSLFHASICYVHVRYMCVCVCVFCACAVSANEYKI